jgi:rare lipoprotein A
MQRGGQESLTGVREGQPRWILGLAIVLPLVIAAALFTLFTVTVQADVPLARPSSTLPPVAPPEALKPPFNVRPPNAAALERLRGIASWYGTVFDGRTTASGERYDLHALTACANELPFGSVVRVVNLRNHRAVVVRINDRGSLLQGRIIDLSYAAAKQLHMMRSGLAPVRLDVLWVGSGRG